MEPGGGAECTHVECALQIWCANFFMQAPPQGLLLPLATSWLIRSIRTVRQSLNRYLHFLRPRRMPDKSWPRTWGCWDELIDWLVSWSIDRLSDQSDWSSNYNFWLVDWSNCLINVSIVAGIWECYCCCVCSGWVYKQCSPPPGAGTWVSTADSHWHNR